MNTIYDFTVRDRQGNDVSLSEYQGKVLLKNAALKKYADMNNRFFGDKAYIGWNFKKFLVDREGKVIARFEPTVDMKEVRSAVEAVL